MTSWSFNIFIIATVYLGVIFNPSHGLNVTQPEHRTLNPDKSVSISCEHDEQVGIVEDVRLYSISKAGKSLMLCQKGMKNCKNIVMYQESFNKSTFVLLNIGPEAMDATYQCEITLKKGDIDLMNKGMPTRLQQGQKEMVEPCKPVAPSPPPPAQLSHLVQWIVTGLLSLMFLYSCVITCLYIRLMKSDNEIDECENSTYVEMRKAPLQRNADFSVYSG